MVDGKMKIAAKRKPLSVIRTPTRERLLGAALELLQTGGESAVTTVSVTHAAGVVQSAFYRHFSNIEECLVEVVENATTEIREVVAGARRRMYEKGPGTGADLEQSYREMFGLVEGQRGLVGLLLRYRSDALALNGVMHRFAQGLSSDLADQLAEQVVRAGLPEMPAVRLRALADYLIAVSLAAIEAHLERRGPAVPEAARILAAFTTGACQAVFSNC